MGSETVCPSAPPPSTATVNPPVPPPASHPPPSSLAPGFRFHPTDEELVVFYLKRKVSGKGFRYDVISEVDIYRNEPWELADKSRLKTRDQEWYFFSALDKKYGNGGRMNRATSKGYWKATGNDRPVTHEQRKAGLKKTLVFHSGRAPDGKRTNWVMHEYRLTEEELVRAIGSSQPKNAYVLCRVFHKSNIGPPNGQRYAAFIEEEWEDDTTGMVPGLVPMDYGSVDNQPEGSGGVLFAERRNDVVQDTLSVNKAPFDVNKLPIETQNLLAVCKRESMAEYSSSPEKDDNNCKSVDVDPSPQIDNPKPVSQYKRRRQNLNSNVDSIQTSQDLCSSTVTTAATTLPVTTAAATTTNNAPKKHFLSALVEFSLQESLESKESLTTIQAPDFDLKDLESMPPSCVKLIKHLQSEMQKLTVEKETLRFEMTSGQAMVNILQSRNDILSKENEDLKRMTQNP